MKFKKTRIAYSVCCGVLYLLLTSLWVQSQSRLQIVSSYRCTIRAFRGVLQVGVFAAPAGPWMLTPVGSKSAPNWWSYSDGKITVVDTPILFPAALCGVGTVAPWIVWRYSLRTLLIAMTAVAVSLWFIVWMSRS